MDEKEIRMRSIEALSGMGIREPERLIRDAVKIAEWVAAGEDLELPLRKKPADKV